MGPPHMNTIIITVQIEPSFVAEDDLVPFRCSPILSYTTPLQTGFGVKEISRNLLDVRFKTIDFNGFPDVVVSHASCYFYDHLNGRILRVSKILILVLAAYPQAGQAQFRIGRITAV
ncbi:hypothetical protein TNCV_218261 [Trichonephila clavipes]|nr:hypothetical protein TNCV_218261 [Trichonephila clavipes]